MSLAAHARRVADLLQRRQLKVVFAESCTGGLVSGALTQIPGISNYHCGSMVVYRSQTKAAWLGIPSAILERPGPVSQKVTALLADAILKQTPEAQLALAVTGHLGPNAPRRLDGIVYVEIARRARAAKRSEPVASLRVRYAQGTTRRQRLKLAVSDALLLLADYLQSTEPTG